MARMLLATIAPLVLLVGCGGQPASDNGADAAASGTAAPEASGAWVRLPAVAGRPGAAYLTIAGGGADAELVAVETPIADRTEIHESMRHGEGHGGMAGMRAIERLAVPAGERVELAPGGYHAMLFDLTGEVVAGTTAPLTLRFADGTTIGTVAQVVAAGSAAPE